MKANDRLEMPDSASVLGACPLQTNERDSAAIARRLRQAAHIVAFGVLAVIAFLAFDARGAHAQTSPPPPNPPTTCTSPATVRLVTASTIYQDYADNPQLTNLYVQYQITNTTASTIQSVQFGITSTTYLTRAQYEDGIYDVNLAPGQSTSVYFYVKTNDVGGSGNSFPNQPMWVALWSGDDATGTALCQRTQIFTVADAGKNNSNKINVVTSQDLGNACFSMFVSGETGNADSPVFFNASPAALDSWPADLLTLQSVTATVQTTQTVRFTDTLALDGLPDPSGTGWPYTIGYRFCVANVTRPVPPLVIRPVNYINTGSSVSQSPFDPANVTVLFPLAIGFKTDNNAIGVVGDRVVYTVTVSNIGTISQTGVSITETVPANTVFTTTGSSAWTGCSAGSPAGTTCSINVGTVFTNSVFTYTFAVVVDPNLPASINTITNTVFGRPSTITSTDTTPLIRRTTAGITKSNGLSNVLAGQALTYTIVVTSAGPSTLQNAVISDIIPSTLTGANWSALTQNATTSPASGTGNISATAIISSGGRITYTLLATVTNGATGTVTNTARILPPAGITLTNSITQATDADPIQLNANLVITKTASPTPTVIAGNVLTYTVVAGNSGPSNIVGAIISDTFPAGLQSPAWTCVAGAGATCNASSGTGSLNNVSVTLNAGSQLTFTITGTIGAGATGSIANSATITVPAGAVDQVPANNTSSVTTAITQVTNLAIDKQAPATAVPGAQLTYTLVVTNNGPSVATNVTVSDIVPAALGTLASASPNCAVTGGVLRCTVATLNVGSSQTFTATFNIPSTATGTVNNTAGVTSTQNTTSVSDSAATTLTPRAALSIIKSAPSTAVAGTALTYTLAVTNNGPSQATNVTVSDTVPAGLGSLTGATPGCAVSAGVLSCNAGTLSVNQSKTFTATFAIPASATGQIGNTAAVTSTETPTETTSTVTTTLQSVANLTITKQAPATAVPGEALTYTLLVTNNGPSVATNVTVSDVVPANLTFDSGTPGCSVSVGVLRCNAGTLTVGQGKTFTATFTIAAGATGQIGNTAAVTSTETPTQTTSTVTTTLTAKAEVGVVKTGPATAVPGALITYTIVVTNAGPSVATGVNVSDTAPAAIPLPSWTCSATNATCANASGNGSLNETVTLQPGGRITFSLSGVIDSAATGSLVNTASITSTSDINTGNNNSTVTTQLTPEADMAINKAGPLTVTIGRPVIYTLTVQNLGQSVANNITVTDDTPAGLTFIGFGGACSGASCNIASMAVNEIATVYISFTIPANYTGTLSITNTATVTATTTDPQLGNNTSQANTSANSLADLTVSKTASSATVTAGTQVTYTIVVTNLGPSDAYTVSVAEVDPNQVPFVPVSVSCSGNSFPCDLGGIPLGESRTITAVYDIPTNYLTPTVVNKVSVQSPTSDNIQSNNSATATVAITSSANLSITKEGPAVIVPGTNAVFTITVRNLGPSDALGVTVSDAGFNGLTSTNSGDCTTPFPCSLGTLTPGSTRQIIATFAVPADFTPAQVTNTASVTSTTTDPQTGNNTDSVTVPVTHEVDLDITKEAPATAIAGESLTYSLTVKNNGPSEATNVTVSDTVPANLTFVSGTSGCAVNGGLLNCTVASLMPNVSKTFTATFDIAAGARGDIGNTAAVTSTETPTETTSTVTTTLQAVTNLSITKDAPATAVAGTQLTYTLSVTNNGPSTANNVTVSDTVPAGLTYVNGSSVCTVTGGVLSCNAGTLAVGGDATFKPVFNIAPSATGQIGNTAAVTSTENLTETTDTVTTTLQAATNLSITKEAPATAIAGTQLTYTLSVTNNGPSVATNVTVSDTAPAGLDNTNLIDATASCTLSNGVLTCSIATLSVNNSKIFTATFKIKADARGEIGNTAVVTSSENLTETTSTVTTTLTSLAVLSITKDAPATAVAGTQLTYTLMVTNNGPSTANNVTVSDTLPVGLTYTGNEANCSVTSGVLSCNAGTLAVGGHATFKPRFNIASSATGQIGNTAAVTSTETPTETTSTVTTTLSAVADLNITKSGPAQATPGKNIQYTLVVSNPGPSDVATGVVSDVLPGELNAGSVSWTCGGTGGATCPPSGTGNLNATVSLPANSTVVFTVTGTITDTATGTITNTASVTPTSATDPNPQDNDDTVETTLVPQVDLDIVKDAPATAVAGTQLTYTIIVTNNGPSQATNVTVSDTVPTGLTYVNGSSVCTVTGGVLSCNAGTLSVGGDATFQPVFNIASNATGNIGNTAAVTSTETPTETTSTVTTTLTSVAALSITKDAPATAIAGTQLTYTVIVTNNGPSQATNVTVSDTVPAGLTYVNGSSSCTVSGGVLSCNAGTLAVGGNATFKPVFDIAPSARGEIGNTAAVTSSENLTETTDAVTTTLQAVTNLSITKDAPVTAIAGTQLTYTIIVTNNGPSQATNVTVSDTVPTGLTYVNGSSVCTVSGGVLSCNAGTLAVGGSATFKPVFNIASSATGQIGNTAAVTSSENLTETTDTVTTTLTSKAVLSITKDAPASAIAGTQLTYTLIVTNNGPSVATNVTVSDTVPTGLTYVNGSSVCTVTGGVLSCNAGTLSVGGHATFQPAFDIGKDVRGQIGNTAAVTSTETPTETTDTVTTTVTAETNLSISKAGPASAVAGGQVTYTVVVTNNGPSNATNVTITDPDPDNLTVVGSPCVTGVCGMGGLKVGESVTLTLKFDIDPFASGSVTNTASVTSTEAPTATSSSASTPLLVSADLSISKTDGQETSYFGAPITYMIVVTNNGPSGVIEAVISDTLPAEVTNAAWSCAAVAPNTCTPANGTGSPVNPLVRLSPYSTVTITVNGVLVTEGENWTLRNVASVQPPPGATDPITSNNTTTDTTNLFFKVDAMVTKTVTPADAVAPGQLFTYVVSIGNTGPSTAIDAIVNDTLPVQMVNPQWVCVATVGSACDTPNSGTGSIAGQQVTIQPSGLVTYTITGTATTDSEVSRSIVNTAQVTFENEMVQDTDLSNNTSTVTVTLTPNAFVSIGKTNGQTIAVPGAMLTYVITLTNQGPSVAYGYLFDIYPPELSSATWQSSGANGALVLDPLNDITTPPGVAVKLPVGSVLTVTGWARVNITATGWLTNVAQFVMSDSIVANNAVTRAVDVDEIVPAVVTGKIFSDLNGNGTLDAGEPGLPGVRVLITASNGATEVTANANGEFSLVVAPGAFSISAVQSSVPAGYALTSANDAQNGLAVAGANATAPIGYQGRGSVSGVVFNDIDGNGTQNAGEPGLPNVIVTLTPNATQAAGVQAAITTTTDSNGNYSFTNVAAGGWMVSAVKPAGFVNTTPLQQSINVTANAGALADFGFQQPGAVVITKAAQTSGSGNQLGNDRLITYTLVVTNTGGSLLSKVLVTDTLPANVQYVSGSATPAPVSTTPLVWQISNLSPGQSAILRFTVKVDAGYNGSIRNIAVADSQVEPPTNSNEVVVTPAPTAISIVRFTAQRGSDGVTVVWQTGFERDTVGFNLLRSATGNRTDAIQVNPALIAGGAKSGEYTFVDGGAEAGVTYTYWLQEIELGGTLNDYPDKAVVQPAAGQGAVRYSVFIPLVMR